MTMITCRATTCRYNSSEVVGEGTSGTCTLDHIELKVKSDLCEECDPVGAGMTDCACFEWNHTKPYAEKDPNEDF